MICKWITARRAGQGACATQSVAYCTVVPVKESPSPRLREVPLSACYLRIVSPHPVKKPSEASFSPRPARQSNWKFGVTR
jgi:hypothetical protein